MTSFNKDTTGLEVVQRFQDQGRGKTIVITGTSDGGLGAETALALAHAHPAHLILLARSQNKVDPLIQKINEVDPTIKTTFVPIELADFASVRSAASSINSLVDHVDILINNAGIMAVPDYTTNDAGIELQFATNHLGHFLLTNLILNKVLAASSGARIVNLTSDGHAAGPFRGDDYNFDNGKDYNAWAAYSQSKTANILFTKTLASKLAGKNILSFAVHPGVILTTSIGRTATEEMFDTINEASIKYSGKPFAVDTPTTVEKGIATSLVASLDPQLAQHSGSYLTACNILQPRDYATSLETAQTLWALSERLVGQEFAI